MNLLQKKCTPCEGGATALREEDAKRFLQETPQWKLGKNEKASPQTGGLRIVREFKFKDFIEAINFINKVADIAEQEGHHPDIHIFYNKVRIELWTHAVNGLSENDFIVAAKIDALYLKE